MTYLCITPNEAKVRIKAHNHAEPQEGNLYLNLNYLQEVRMEQVANKREGEYLAIALLIFANQTHEVFFHNSPAGTLCFNRLQDYLSKNCING